MVGYGTYRTKPTTKASISIFTPTYSRILATTVATSGSSSTNKTVSNLLFSSNYVHKNKCSSQ